jgi:HEAT repeat protein
VRNTDSGPELLRIAQGQRPEWHAASIRSAAVQALGNYPPGLTHAVLERLVSDTESLVASAAQHVLAKQKQ